MLQLSHLIAQAQSYFADTLDRYVGQALTVEQYQRYLSMQYHLTKGVQHYFFAAASHSDMRHRRDLRNFLLRFAVEEELHYVVAGSDLLALGLPLLAQPLDVTLWHGYFEDIVRERPFIRLGAAVALENMSGGVASERVKAALKAPFLTRDNTKFVVIHQHERLPHGAQIVTALAGAELTDAHWHDVFDGINIATVMFLRMTQWALDPKAQSTIADRGVAALKVAEQAAFTNFSMQALETA